MGISMTYFLVFRLTPWGLMTISDIYKYNGNDKVEYIPEPIKGKKRNNVYGDIYFVSIMPEDLQAKLRFVRTNLKPLWTKEHLVNCIYGDYIYAFKLLYYKEFENVIPYNSRANEVIKIAKSCLEQTINEYKSKFGNSDIKYILTVDYRKRSTHSKINIYIVQPLTKEEAIKFIKENEALILWELI
jgi:hypothetical protein